MDTPSDSVHQDAPKSALWRTVALHLLPGWLTGLLYLPLGAALEQRNLPPVWALMGDCALGYCSRWYWGCCARRACP